VTRARWNVLIVVVLLAGIGWIWVNRLPSGAGAAGVGALPPAPAVGHPAPDFTVTDTAGKPFKLAALRGTPVVLNFWATWCPPCRAELPELQAGSERLAGQVAIVGLNQGETLEEVRTFAEQLGLSFQIPLDERMDVSRAYGVRSLPTTFFIDRSGVIRDMQIGPLTEATLAQHLRQVYP
jgi:cytochrome c biogenesis protein CcmG, thiol:disulfide interchange protein DsbE